MSNLTLDSVNLAIACFEELSQRDTSQSGQIRCLQYASGFESILTAGSLCEGIQAWNNYKLTRFRPLLSGRVDGRFPIFDWLSAVRCEVYGNYDLFIDEQDATRLVEEIDRLNAVSVSNSKSTKNPETEVF